MRIVHVISRCSAGGAEQYTQDLLLNMKRLGHEVQLWTVADQKSLSRQDEAEQVYEASFISDLRKHDIEVLSFEKRPRRDFLKCIRKIRSYYKDFKPDIVQAHYDIAALLCGIGLKKYHVPVILTLHNTFNSNRLLYRYILSSFIDGFIAISEKVRGILLKNGVDEQKIALIYNGIDLKDFSCQDFQDQVDRFITVGRIVPLKNHCLLLDSFSAFLSTLDTKNKPVLEIVGDGPVLNELKEYASTLEISDYVIFSGLCRNIPERLSHAQIYVCSSDTEALSISLIEALASGLSLIATDVGSNDEIITHAQTGLIVPPKNRDALRDAMIQLYGSCQKRQLFFKQAPLTIQRFSIQAAVEAHLRFFSDFLSE